jgi:MFS family permease
LLGGRASLFAVCAVMIILGVAGAMETPNGAACIPQLVPEDKLEFANGVIQAAQSLSGILAPIVGGVLYGTLGLKTLTVISGAAFALASVMETFIKIPFSKRARPGGMLETITADLKDGFAYVWKDLFIRKMTALAALLNLVLVPCFIVAAPLVLRITLGADDAFYGAGMGIIQFAVIIGAAAVGVFGKKMRANTIWRWILAIAALFAPLALAVSPIALGSGFLPPFVLFLLCISLMAMATSALSIFVIAKVQMKTPNENLGKAMAIIQTAAQCAAPAGQMIYGFMFKRFNAAVYFPLLLAGFLTAGIALIGKIVLKKETDNDAGYNNS